jgi:hypothetical protein
MAIPKSIADRFWAKVDRSGDCWVWTASKAHGGYGKFNALGVTVRSHRFAYELEHGPIDADLFVCHHCDNPPCVRPSHLFLGTAMDNIVDKVRKRRARGASTLSDADVCEVRRLFASGVATRPELARQFRVGLTTIRRITVGGWAHLPPVEAFGSSGVVGDRGGERNGNAVLTRERAQAIRDRYAAGGVTQQRLWTEYGVSRATIQRVLHGKCWL